MQEDPVRTVPLGTGRPVSPHVAPMLHPMSHALPGVPGTHWEVVMHVPLQRACPDGHAQAPFWQVVPPVHVNAGPQPPQLGALGVALLLSSMHAPLQRLKPPVHVIAHVVPLHIVVPVPLVGPGQAMLHMAPQLLAVVGPSQVPPQLSAVGAVHPHVPPEQCWPPVHARHAAPPVPVPQTVSVSAVTHAVAPVGLLQQPVHPVVVLHAHAPAAQVVPAPQTLPQPPQLALLVFGLTQALLQTIWGAVQPAVQTPATHDTVPPPGAVQRVQLGPQLLASVSLAHVPVLAQRC